MDEVEFYLKDLASRFKGIDKSKYYLSYSGGKDSHFLYWFIKEYLHDTEIEIVAVNTYMEHPEILKRMINNADRILLPKLKPFEIKEKYGSPCFSKSQDFFIYYYQNAIAKGKSPSKSIYDRFMGTYPSWHNVGKKAREYVLTTNSHKISHLCCKYLKKEPFRLYEKKTSKKPILGVRGSESKMRSTQYKTCFTKDDKFIPLYDLDDELLNQIYKKHKIEIPKVYDYVSRTDCVGCPYGSYKHEVKKELGLVNPKRRNFITKLFKESYDVLGIDTEENV